MRSQIIVFSARSLMLARSSSGGRLIGAVPLIGSVVTYAPARRRNSSGDRLTPLWSGSSTKAE